MKAKILEQSEEEKWDRFVKNHPLQSIHQFSKWGHFQAKVPGRGRYWIIVLEDEGAIVGGALLVRHHLPRNQTWLNASRGPLLDFNSPKIQKHFSLLTQKAREIAKKENAIFLRFDPPLLKTKPYPKLKNTYKAPHSHYPTHTLTLDLTRTEDELLAQMKPKGRYNIRLAAKKGVTIRKSDPTNSTQFQKDLSAFHRILHETTTRDQFYGHKKIFYQSMIETLHPAATLYLAEHDGQPIAGIINTGYNDTAIYYYGASSNSHRNLMAPYLLQWRAIKDAKAQNLTHYDFLGIAPPASKNHHLAGVTDFKLKFGGKTLAYHTAREHPFKPLHYLAYRLYKFIKK